MNKTKLDFQSHFLRYHDLIMSCKIHETAQSNELAINILKNKDRYKFVSDHTDVPWPLIACLHHKEASMSFYRNLHNGEKLDRITKLVPKGRGPFSSWEESAIDALKLKKNLISQIYKGPDTWSLEKCLWFAESYNGWGYYLYRPINSPYLWTGTNHYTIGGYPKDGVWDQNFKIKNIGIAPILLTLLEMDKLDLFIEHISMHEIGVRLNAIDVGDDD
jgi:lysozyme family protein